MAKYEEFSYDVSRGLPSPFSIFADVTGRQIQEAIVFEEKVLNSIRLLPYQEEVERFLLTPHPTGNFPVALTLGALGCGKSRFAAHLLFLTAARFPGINILVGRETHEVLKDVFVDGAESFPTQLRNMGVTNFNMRLGDMVLELPGGSAIYFRSLRKEKQLGSYPFGAFLIEEASNSTEEFFTTACNRLRQKVPIKFGLLCANPPSKEHWLYRVFVEEAKTRYKIWHIDIDQNPYLDAGYVSGVKSDYRKKTSLYNRLVLGQWGAEIRGHARFAHCYDSEVHRSKEVLSPVSELPVYRVWDFGYCMPFVLYGQVLSTTRVRILRALRGKYEKLKQFIPRVLLYSSETFPNSGFIDICDPHGEQRSDMGTEENRIEILRTHDIKPLYTYAYSIAQRNNKIEDYLSKLIGGKPAIEISAHPSLDILHEALETGCQVDNDGGIIQDGFYEHPIDDLGYLLVNTVCAKSDKRIEGRYQSKKIQEPGYGFAGKSKGKSKDRFADLMLSELRNKSDVRLSYSKSRHDKQGTGRGGGQSIFK